MNPNPWLVDSVQAFSCLKCPECDFHAKEEIYFRNHALENHPMSFVLFHKKDLDDTNDSKSSKILNGSPNCQDFEDSQSYSQEVKVKDIMKDSLKDRQTCLQDLNSNYPLKLQDPQNCLEDMKDKELLQGKSNFQDSHNDLDGPQIVCPKKNEDVGTAFIYQVID